MSEANQIQKQNEAACVSVAIHERDCITCEEDFDKADMCYWSEESIYECNECFNRRAEKCK